MSDWIPCSERLPEHDGMYETTVCTRELCGDNSVITSISGYFGGLWDEGDAVIAWMPLPKPYREPKNG